MATFAYDTTGAPPLEMDFPLIDDTYATGEFLACGTTDGTDLGALKSAAGIYASVVGILVMQLRLLLVHMLVRILMRVELYTTQWVYIEHSIYLMENLILV